MAVTFVLMSHPDGLPTQSGIALPWPTGWAHRTRGPQYRPAVVGGVVCTLFACTLALNNLADGFVLIVFAMGLFVYALRPAHTYPVRVSLGEVPGPRSPLRGVQFPLRISNPLAVLRRRPTVTLTPTAVVADRGSALVIPWSAITEVRATAAITGIPHSLLPAPRQNWLTIAVTDPAAVDATASRLLRRFGGNTVAGFATTSLLSDPVVLYHTLHYYLDNPQARPELADRCAIDRIRAARVDPVDS
jgi:hypothetical protein